MLTITNKYSLIHFNQNRNGSNIYGNSGENIDWILKPIYQKFFENITLKLQNKITGFIKNVWQKECDKTLEEVHDVLSNYFQRYNIPIDETAENNFKLVMMKVRGNLGEIFAEFFFTHYGYDYNCNSNKYIPIDPTNEDYTDAETENFSTGLPLNIQIKNYAHEPISREIFDKCCAMMVQRIHGSKAIISEERKLDYISNSHQMIFSFTDVKDQRLLNDYDLVTFLGPNIIDSKTYYPKFFQDIAEEISKL